MGLPSYVTFDINIKGIFLKIGQVKTLIIEVSNIQPSVLAPLIETSELILSHVCYIETTFLEELVVN